jgi:peroxiredoxin
MAEYQFVANLAKETRTVELCSGGIGVFMRKIFLAVAILCFVLFFTACGQRPKVAEVGKLAPDFTLLDTKGKTWNLTELEGQVVFVNFWATWCAPCREEMPSMQRLYKSLPVETFKMLAILNNDKPAFGEQMAAKLGVTFPILIDPDNKIGQAYGLTGVPETFIVDKQGVLREKIIGPAPWDSPGARQMLLKYIGQ